MSEKQFVLYEHKGDYYVLKNPRLHLDFIEMLGDALTSEEIVEELNQLNDKVVELAEKNEQLKNYFKKRAECSNFQINKLKEEIEELKRERDDWKSSTCSYMNKDSLLSMDCQIVHEALWELEKEIEFGSKREDLFFDLKEKFEKLNNHRIGVFDDK